MKRHQSILDAFRIWKQKQQNNNEKYKHYFNGFEGQCFTFAQHLLVAVVVGSLGKTVQ